MVRRFLPLSNFLARRLFTKLCEAPVSNIALRECPSTVTLIPYEWVGYCLCGIGGFLG